MKYKGKNVITSDDITLLGKNIGKTLDNVLESLENDTEELKSNVKWIYKYGGVGSGSGGGTSSKWSVSCNIQGKSIYEGENTLSFPERGKYDFYLHINNPNGDTFIVTYKYGTGSNQKIILNLENLWTYRNLLTLLDNGLIQINILDGNGVDKNLSAEYIVEAYELNVKLVNKEGISFIPTNNLFTFAISNIVLNGLYLSINYNNIIENTRVVVSYNKLSGNTETREYILDKVNNKELFIDGDNDTLFINLVDIENFGDNNAGEYPISINVFVDGLEYFSKDYICSFIPSLLYLLVFPTSGIIYKNLNTLVNPYTYYVGNISFYITPYDGLNFSNSLCKITTLIYKQVDLSWEEISSDTKGLSITERKTDIYSINVVDIGWIKIRFNLEKGTTTTYSEYYFLTKEVENTIDWYTHSPMTSVGYKYSYPFASNNKLLFKLGNTNINNNELIILFTNSDNLVLDFPTLAKNSIESSHPDFIFHIGLQYNSINDTEEPILEFVENSTGGSLNSNNIKISLNKIELGSNEIFFDSDSNVSSLFIEKQLNYNSYTVDNYHLLTICRRKIKSTELSITYEYSAYMDGILCGVSILSYNPNYTRVIIYKGNFSINLLEMSYYDSGQDTLLINDIDIVNYYYSYLEKLLHKTLNQTKIELSNALSNFIHNYDEKGHIEGELNDIKNIAQKASIPSLLIKYEKTQLTSLEEAMPDFFDWSDLSYDAEQTPLLLDVSIEWTEGNGKEFSPINTIFNTISTELSNLIIGKFLLKILGTSSKSFKSKNYELILKTNSSDIGLLYTPRFNSTNRDGCFLPEESFTLKADIVDSSHTNNTCIGKFINDNTRPFNPPTASSANVEFKNYIRNCLEGFPILLFLQYTKENDTKYYYLGIYNFNLGRKSYFNLGHYNLNDLTRITSESPLQENLFAIVPYNKNTLALYPNFIVGEILENVPLFDFSNYDDTVLFAKDDKDVGMFGDIDAGSPNLALSGIKTFVEKTSKAGGYIFGNLGLHKEFRSIGDTSGYKNGINKVPNPAILYKRQFQNGKHLFIPPEITEEAINNNLNDIQTSITSLYNYIFDHLDSNSEESPSYVNYNSLIEYYTICMAFGMVDSVLKNLNIKSWNGGETFYLSFYDMDTCLGVDNAGKNTTYFAFSDYWKLDSPEVIDGELDIYKITPARICRDYCPMDNESGIDSKLFDTPSSYLFAVAKYAKAVLKHRDIENAGTISGLTTPSDLWASWRSTNGPLKNADTFMDNYFTKHMENVNEMMFNLNYRTKYIFFSDPNSTVLSGDYSKFRGYRKIYIKDWLDKRLHILDAYFNLSNATSSLIDDSVSVRDEDIIYESTPNPNITYTYLDNPDVTICRDIFVPGNTTRTYSGLNFTVQASDYTPLIIRAGSLIYRYLLENQRYKYRIENDLESSGIAYMLGGSPAWNYLDSINFAGDGSTLYMNSNNISILQGNGGNISGWNLNLPSLKEVHLNSKNYSGDLVFRLENGIDKFPNLDVIDISGSKISLEVNGENIRSVIANNILNSNFFNIINCNKLLNLQFTGSTNLLQLTSWNNDFIANGTSITNLQIICDNSGTNKTFDYKNDSSVKTINLKGFLNVKIDSCRNLKTIILSGDVRTVSITNCISIVDNIEIILDDLQSLNLKGCSSLTSFKLVLSPSMNYMIDYQGITAQTNQNLKLLDISNTKCSKCYIIKDNQFKNILSYNNLDILDLRYFDNLGVESSLLGSLVGYFKCINNSSIKYIYLSDNNKHRVGSFYNCINLKRIFGNLLVTNDTTFSGCSNFTLLGESTDTWKGNPKINDQYQVLTPFELISNNIDGVFNHNEGKIADNEYGTRLTKDFYEKYGDFETRVYIDPSTTRNDNLFSNTSTTIFDMYYMLNALAISFFRNSNALNYSIRATFNTKQKFTGTMAPSRYMFFGCYKIIDIFEMRSGDSATFKLKSPNISSDPVLKHEEVTRDNGFFSHLINIGRIHSIFGGAKIKIDKYLLRRTYSNEYSYSSRTFSNLYSFSYVNIINIYNNFWFEGDPNNEFLEGDMTDFFFSTPNITTLTSVFNCNLINFNTLKIPSTIKYIQGSFLVKYGKAEDNIFPWDDIFGGDNYSNLESLTNSFNINSFDNNNYPKLTFTINNGMFSKMKNLKYIGYESTTNNVGGMVTKSKTLNTEVTFAFGFHGSGFLKEFENGLFPSEITKDLLNLETFVGVFSEVESNIEFEFPGEMFLNNTKLTTIASLFLNAKCNINLTSEGFKNCPKLENVNRLFYSSIKLNKDSYSTGTIQNSIPFRFFYTGELKTLKTYYSITSEDYDKYFGETAEEEPTTSNYEDWKVTINITNYNTPLINMVECFFGLDTIKAYTWKNPEEEIDITKLLEIDRIPLPNLYQDHEYNNENYYYLKGGSWIEKSTLDPQYSISLIYDGNSNNLNDEYYCDDLRTEIRAVDPGDQMKKQSILNYFCPPDLLAYTKNTSDTNIRGMFRLCGLLSESTYSPKRFDSTGPGAYYIGIYGRICPYLFKSLTNLTHLFEFFEWCKGLTGYTCEGITELIPSTLFKHNKNLTGLAKTFSGMCFYEQLSSEFLTYIKNNMLDVRGIFSNCIFLGNTSLINGFFTTNKIRLSAAWGAFNGAYLLLDNNGTCSYYIDALGENTERIKDRAFSSSVKSLLDNFVSNSFDCFNSISGNIKNSTVQDLYKYFNKGENNNLNNELIVIGENLDSAIISLK